MALYVAQGKTLRMALVCKIPNETHVTFKRKGAEVCPPLTLPVRDFTPAGKGQHQCIYRWTGAGIPDDENDARIVMENDKKETTGKPTEIIVYRDALQLQASAADGSPVAGARARVSVQIDQEWAAATRYPGPPNFSVDVDTNGQGLAVAEGLPYGAVTVTFISPTKLVAWQAEAGAIRRATVVQKVSVPVKLQWPPPVAPGAPHKQWVNLNEVDAAAVGDNARGPHYGSLVKVKVRLADGVAPAGQTVWLMAKFDEGNSTRSGKPWRVLDGWPTGIEEHTVVRSRPVDVHGVATFELEVGAAGGDKIALYAAGHPDVSEVSHDEATYLETWRRIELQVMRWTSADPKIKARLQAAQPRVPEESKRVVETEFARACILPVWLDGTEASCDDRLKLVTGKVAASLKLPSNKDNVLWDYSSMKFGESLPEKEFGAGKKHKFYPPRFSLYLFHIIIKRFRTATWTADVDARVDDSQEMSAATNSTGNVRRNIRSTMKLPNSGGFFLLRDWDDKSAVLKYAGGQDSYWQATDLSGQAEKGNPVTITEDYIQIDTAGGNQSAELKVPKAARPATPTVAKVMLKMQMFASVAGGSQGPVLALTMPVPAEGADSLSRKQILKTAYVILHEIGHSVGIAVLNPAKEGVGPPDEATNDLHYTHSGDHCAAGVADMDAEPWNQVGTTVSGTCLMYSPVHKETPYEEVTKFCERCLRHLRATNFGRYGTETNLTGEFL